MNNDTKPCTTTDTEVTATLEDWRVEQTYLGLIFWGKIYGDTKRRFVNGTTIHTSLVLRVEDGKVYTLNSVYKLGKQMLN